MLKVSFEKPKFAIAEEVKAFLKKDGRKKKEERKPWTHKERLLVGALLALTILGSIYFWYKGQERLPSFDFGGINFGETVIIEK